LRDQSHIQNRPIIERRLEDRLSSLEVLLKA
jgi:hypothetical protein